MVKRGVFTGSSELRSEKVRADRLVLAGNRSAR